MRRTHKGRIIGVLILFLILPVIPTGLIWYFVSPATVWQIIAMIILSAILYICFILVEIGLMVILEAN